VGPCFPKRELPDAQEKKVEPRKFKVGERRGKTEVTHNLKVYDGDIKRKGPLRRELKDKESFSFRRFRNQINYVSYGWFGGCKMTGRWSENCINTKETGALKEGPSGKKNEKGTRARSWKEKGQRWCVQRSLIVTAHDQGEEILEIGSRSSLNQLYCATKTPDGGNSNGTRATYSRMKNRLSKGTIIRGSVSSGKGSAFSTMMKENVFRR